MFPAWSGLFGELIGMRFLKAVHGVVAASSLIMVGHSFSESAAAQVVVPGTGMRAEAVGDDFEDEKWAYVSQNPKSSHEQDDQIRTPAGYSTNGRWSESAKRGHPDVVKRVPTPPEGIPGSQGSLLIRTLGSGVPGTISGQNQQDDLICNVNGRLKGFIPVSSNPSVVVRVAIPPFEKWEQRQGNSFGLRLSIEGTKPYDGSHDTYWPGIFIYYYPAAPERGKTPAHDAYAQLVLRSGPVGNDLWGPKITEPGWWTLGMSCSPDGMIHYFGHAGVENLKREDLISSQSPYGFRAERLQSFFFDVVNRDDGRSWSTSWIVDDPMLYYTSRQLVAGGGAAYAPKEDRNKENNNMGGRGWWRRR
jgi:hypothetical protein